MLRSFSDDDADGIAPAKPTLEELQAGKTMLTELLSNIERLVLNLIVNQRPW